jgi:hypothetical protein
VTCSASFRAVMKRPSSISATKASVKPLILLGLEMQVKNSPFPASVVTGSHALPEAQAWHSEKLSHRDVSQKYRVIQKMWHQEMHIIIIIFLIHMCIQCLGHFSPLCSPCPYFCPFPFPAPITSLPGRNYFALISNFVEERV